MAADSLHPELTPAERRRLFLEGVELFNRGEHYACHESFEEIWRSTTPEPRDLFQGLIQLAVGLHHHLVRGNPGPARRVLARGRRRLHPFRPRSHGLDVDALLGAAEAWDRWLGRVLDGGEEAAGTAPPIPMIRVLEDREVR